jgi:hypothetical protein
MPVIGPTRFLVPNFDKRLEKIEPCSLPTNRETHTGRLNLPGCSLSRGDSMLQYHWQCQFGFLHVETTGRNAIEKLKRHA